MSEVTQYIPYKVKDMSLPECGFQFFDFVTEYRYGRKELNRRGQLVFDDALFLRTPEDVLENLSIKSEVYEIIVDIYGKTDLLKIENGRI